MHALKKRSILFFGVSLVGLLSSCSVSMHDDYVLANKEIRQAALSYANEYIKQGAEYLWSGQDPLPKTIYVDCSGLVIRCYQYACNDYGYKLPFVDTTACEMQSYCVESIPESGDLIFMGDEGIVTHVAIFDKEENGYVYFIDSTNLTGRVSERVYPINSAKIICYKRIYVERK